MYMIYIYIDTYMCVCGCVCKYIRTHKPINQKQPQEISLSHSVFDLFLSAPGGSLRQLREVLLLRAHLHGPQRGHVVAVLGSCWEWEKAPMIRGITWDNMG